MTQSQRIALALLCAVCLVLLSGCGASSKTGATQNGSNAQESADVLSIRIGAMSNVSCLPVWVAEERGFFKEVGLDAKIEVFQSGSERNTALESGAIDCALGGDGVSLALFEKAGVPMAATTVILGTTPQQGRDGIVVKPGSKITQMSQLVGVPIGTSTSTHQEYVLDGLFARVGTPRKDVAKEEVKKVPIRYQLLMDGQLEAAALPEPWLSLAEMNGARVISDDASGPILSVDLMIAKDDWLATKDGAEAMTRMLKAWDRAVELINEDPDAWRDTLVAKAGVPKELRDKYKVDAYPTTQLPAKEPLGREVQWAVDAGLVDSATPYDKLVWLSRP